MARLPGLDSAFVGTKAQRRASPQEISNKFKISVRLLRRPNFVLVQPQAATRLFKIEGRQIGVLFV